MSKILKLEELLQFNEQDDKLIKMATDYLSRAYRMDKTNPDNFASDIIGLTNNLVSQLGISDSNKIKIYRSLINRLKETIMGKEEI